MNIFVYPAKKAVTEYPKILAGDYAIIVSAFEPRYRGAYSLRIESTSKVDVSAIPMEGAGMFCKTVRGRW